MAASLALLTGGCANGASETGSAHPSRSPAVVASPTDSPTVSVSAQPSESPTASPTPEPGLAVGRMATVVADSVVVRTEPGRQSDFVIQPCTGHGGPCPNLLLGPNTEYTSVYLMDGPVQADGYEWFLAAVSSPEASYPWFAGWIPTGDSAGPWVLPTEAQCPVEPIELEDVTLGAPQLDLLSCLGDRELSLTGWLPAPPSTNEECVPIPGRDALCSFGPTIVRSEEAEWAGDGSTSRPWIGETAAGLSAPPRDAWVTIRGSFDHPASRQCFDGDPHAVILCQLDFVVTSIEVVGDR